VVEVGDRELGEEVVLAAQLVLEERRVVDRRIPNSIE